MATTQNKGTKIRKVEVDLTPPTDFYVIMRQKLDANGEADLTSIEMESGKRGFEKFPGYMYSTLEEAEEKCVEYMKQRHTAGHKYQYFVMHPVSMVTPKIG